MKRSNVATQLVRLREQAGHTQHDAALAAGVSTRTWRRYEAGKPMPDVLFRDYQAIVKETRP